MKPAPFKYLSPRSVDECLRLLDELRDDAAVIAGGQSLVPLLRFRLAQPGHIVSLRELRRDLSYIRTGERGVVIGATVTYAQAQRSPELRAMCPGVPEAIELIATPAVRARGTLCGNLCHADPASELPAMALLLDARLTLRSLAGDRTVAASEFFQGPYATARRSDELLTEIEFPARPEAEKCSIREVTRQRGGFPMAGVAVALARAPNGRPRSVAMACFAVNAVQLRLREAEAALMAIGCTDEGIAAAAQALDAAIAPHDDAFASAAYRRSAARTLLRRAVLEAMERP
jgi:carbon-monoxide dehydrogenase medium subunit